MSASPATSRVGRIPTPNAGWRSKWRQSEQGPQPGSAPKPALLARPIWATGNGSPSVAYPSPPPLLKHSGCWPSRQITVVAVLSVARQTAIEPHSPSSFWCSFLSAPTDPSTWSSDRFISSGLFRRTRPIAVTELVASWPIRPRVRGCMHPAAGTHFAEPAGRSVRMSERSTSPSVRAIPTAGTVTWHLQPLPTGLNDPSNPGRSSPSANQMSKRGRHPASSDSGEHRGVSSCEDSR